MMTRPGQVLGPDARADVSWRISSYSDYGGGNCVEAGALRDATGRVVVRHSHHPEGLALVCGQRTWTAFVAGVKNDEFTA
ncbi:MAG TPA: DUF397 domain-containing protein [Pseudonocardiaceae bacterium]|nr:DUF397 domain-containing protein [Pseudonocardiaceae bacterium]